MTYLKNLIFITYMKLDFIKTKKKKIHCYLHAYYYHLRSCACVCMCYNPLHRSKVKRNNDNSDLA